MKCNKPDKKPIIPPFCVIFNLRNVTSMLGGKNLYKKNFFILGGKFTM
jgi:hypothetical protein